MVDDRYQNRPFPSDDDRSRADALRPRSDVDPLAELARLIGQSDPFAGSGAGYNNAPRRDEPAAPDAEEDTEIAPVGPPSWMKRVAAQENHRLEHPQPEATDQHELETVYPVKHYEPEPEPDYHPAPSFAAAHPEPHAGHHHQEPVDPARYDDALYGRPDPGYEQPQDHHYQEDPYAYGDAYAEEPAPKRRGGLMTVGVVLALAVIGTGAAYGYRTYMGSTRSGEPPVIKADTGPNKVVPPSSADANANAKLIQDRLGAAPEKMVSREETPVNVQDATKAGGPRVVFPPLNQNANPPSTASVSPASKPTIVGTPSMQGDEPRKIRTFAVRGEDPNATPAARQAPARLTGAPPAAVPARPAATSTGGAPLSLSPQGAAPAPAAPARIANNAPQPIAPAAGGGSYMVQIASQRSEAEASASFKALQGKYPSVLGSRSAQIKKADLGEKGTYYRAMVGPFGSSDEAAQMCGSLKSAGGSCVVQRN